jgi:isohexenylglutaconyl-CoA hydratase
VTAARLNAAQALAIGLVHEAHSTAELDAALARVVIDTLQCAPGAVAATKALLMQGRFVEPAAMVPTAAAAFSRAVRGPEGAEGMAAFIARRKPNWAPGA